jgi:hypothetical protein
MPSWSTRLSVAVGLFVSCALGSLIAAERSSSAMAAGATRFLAALTAEQRQQAAFRFSADERMNWHYIPRERKGLPIKQMTEPQRQLARGLLKTGLSQKGYLTATSIMDLETVLGDLERRSARPPAIVRDPELYFFSIFGTPGAKETWGWRVEGHHVSLNFTIVNGTLMATTPWFFGVNPAEVREGPNKGLRILAGEEDTAYALVAALDEPQRARATIDVAAPNEIITENKVRVDPLKPVGILVSDLTARQRDLLMQVVESYTSAMPADLSAERLAALKKAGVEKIGFAWAGETERGKKHYYRLQGPTFLVEFDNTQNDANHIHSVWRDFAGDFGADLLREHVKSTPH